VLFSFPFFSFFLSSFAFPFLFFFLSFLWCASILSWDRPGRRAKGELATSRLVRTANRKTGKNVRRHDLYRSHASMNKQKKTNHEG